MLKLFAIVSFLLWSCKPSVKEYRFNKEVVSEEIKTMLFDYHEAMNERGLMAEFDFLDSSDNFFWVPPGYRSALSYDSVRKIISENAGSLKKVSFTWEQLQVFALNDSLGNYYGIVNGALTDTNGSDSKVSIIESGTVIKRSSGWMLLSGQSSLLELENDSI